uniref:Uncharacterized protein n=1 Tax=Anguilla anguilla TaxID=7936 RepID=A0A0E9XT02_ANGAN
MHKTPTYPLTNQRVPKTKPFSSTQSLEVRQAASTQWTHLGLDGSQLQRLSRCKAKAPSHPSRVQGLQLFTVWKTRCFYI